MRSRELGDGFVAHQALVGYGANLVYQRVGFFLHFAQLAKRYVQGVAVAMGVAVDLCGAGDDDGSGVACVVQDVGLHDECRAAEFAGLFFVGLGLEVNLP